MPIAARSDVYVGVDIGGTKLSTAVVSVRGEVFHSERRHTEPGWTARENLKALDEMVAGALEASGGPEKVRGLGVGFGGPVDFEAGRVMRSHHVPGWEGCPLRDHFLERLPVPCVVDNDANAGGLGEARFGAGRGAQSVLYVNIGTGIGGAVIIRGEVVRGANSAAGEIGHCVIVPGGPVCTCGQRGCLEALCSGRSIARRATEAAEADPARGKHLERGPEGTISAEAVFAAAVKGDALAREIVRETVDYLALGIAAAGNVLDPEVIVLGGGVPSVGEVLLGPLREAVRALSTEARARNLRLEGAALKYDAGVIGAAALAMPSEPFN